MCNQSKFYLKWGIYMIHAQNEIKYRVAVGMLQKLAQEELLTPEEFSVAHGVVINRYYPALSADCRGYSHGYVVSLLADKEKGDVKYAGSTHHRGCGKPAA